MWENILEPDGPHITIWRMRFARWIPKAATQTKNMYYLLFFSTTPMVARRHLNVTIRTLPVSLHVGRDNEMHLTAIIFP